MTYLIFIVFWLIGGFVTAFTIVPILIILFFAIPFTKKLKKTGVIIDNRPINKSLVSLFLLSIIYIVVIWLVSRYTNSLIAFVIGTIIVLIFSIGKVGENENNVKDYFEGNEGSVSKEKIDEMYKKLNTENNKLE